MLKISSGMESIFNKTIFQNKIMLPSRPLFKKAGATASSRSEAESAVHTKKPQNQPFSIMLPDEEKEITQGQETVEAAAESPVVTEEVTETPTAEAVIEEVVEETAPVVEAAAAETPAVEAVAETVVEDVAEEVAPVVEAVAEETAPVAEKIEVAAEAVVEEEAPIVAETTEETPAAVGAPAARPRKEKSAPAAEEEEDEEVELPVFDPVLAGGAHDDFNWNINKRGTFAYTDEERAAMLKQYDATLSNVTENEIITGRVSAISGGDVVLDINYKSDGLIPMSEFRDIPGLAQGDEEIGRAHV